MIELLSSFSPQWLKTLFVLGLLLFVFMAFLTPQSKETPFAIALGGLFSLLLIFVSLLILVLREIWL